MVCGGLPFSVRWRSVPPLGPGLVVAARRVGSGRAPRRGTSPRAALNVFHNTGHAPEGVDDESQEDYLSHRLFTLR